MSITLTREQQEWIAAAVERGDYASIEDAVRQLLDERIAEMEIEEDDLAWAKPLVDEALRQEAEGRIISMEEYEKRMDTFFKGFKR